MDTRVQLLSLGIGTQIKGSKSRQRKSTWIDYTVGVPVRLSLDYIQLKNDISLRARGTRDVLGGKKTHVSWRPDIFSQLATKARILQEVSRSPGSSLIDVSIPANLSSVTFAVVAGVLHRFERKKARRRVIQMVRWMKRTPVSHCLFLRLTCHTFHEAQMPAPDQFPEVPMDYK